MKKVITMLIVLISIFLLISCDSADEKSQKADRHNETADTVENTDPGDSIQDVTFITGDFPYEEWKNNAPPLEDPIVPDMETAMGIATAVFNGMEKPESVKDNVLSSVFYDEQNEVWIVSFGKKQDESEGIIIGGDCYIAIQKEDGKVLYIGYGE